MTGAIRRPMRGDTAITRSVLTVVLLTALLGLGLAFQGWRGVFETTEGRYSSVASEMLRLDDWLVPRLSEEEPHFTKPPLTYWLLAASISAHTFRSTRDVVSSADDRVLGQSFESTIL
jgi:4-amino-4-deoxy-L-arabinose transferase-like glycosyltransferase